MKEVSLTDYSSISRLVFDAIANKQARDILLLDVSKVTSLADYFILCTADSERQLQAISDHVQELLYYKGETIRKQQGTSDSGWVILDYGFIIIHIFTPETRRYYELEKIWKGANTLIKMM